MAGYVTKHLLGAALALCLAAASVAPVRAADIKYAVNQVKGDASVTGYIMTDGTLGNIGPSHIIDWYLLLDDGSNTDPLSPAGKFALLSSSSHIATFSAFTASASALLFNFDGEGGALFQNPVIGSHINYLAFDSSAGGSGGAYSAIDWRVNGALISIHYSGSPPVALAVPEPSAYVLLLAGLMLLALPLRRRQQAARRR